MDAGVSGQRRSTGERREAAGYSLLMSLRDRCMNRGPVRGLVDGSQSKSSGSRSLMCWRSDGGVEALTMEADGVGAAVARSRSTTEGLRVEGLRSRRLERLRGATRGVAGAVQQEHLAPMAREDRRSGAREAVERHDARTGGWGAVSSLPPLLLPPFARFSSSFLSPHLPPSFPPPFPILPLLARILMKAWVQCAIRAGIQLAPAPPAVTSHRVPPEAETKQLLSLSLCRIPQALVKQESHHELQQLQ